MYKKPAKIRLFFEIYNFFLHLLFFYRIAGEFDTEFAEDFAVHFGEHYSGVDLTTSQLG